MYSRNQRALAGNDSILNSKLLFILAWRWLKVTRSFYASRTAKAVRRLHCAAHLGVTDRLSDSYDDMRWECVVKSIKNDKNHSLIRSFKAECAACVNKDFDQFFFFSFSSFPQTGRKEKGDPLNSAIDKMTKKTRDLRRQVSFFESFFLFVLLRFLVMFLEKRSFNLNLNLILIIF